MGAEYQPAEANEFIMLELFGLNSPHAIGALHNVVMTAKPFIVFVPETKCFKNKMGFIRISLVFFCRQN